MTYNERMDAIIKKYNLNKDASKSLLDLVNELIEAKNAAEKKKKGVSGKTRTVIIEGTTYFIDKFTGMYFTEEDKKAGLLVLEKDGKFRFSKAGLHVFNRYLKIRKENGYKMTKLLTSGKLAEAQQVAKETAEIEEKTKIDQPFDIEKNFYIQDIKKHESAFYEKHIKNYKHPVETAK